MIQSLSSIDLSLIDIHPESWGDWYFHKANLCLNLLPKGHSTRWTHQCPFYQIDLEKINSNADILFWIYQLNGKNLNLYGEDVVKDLVRAFDDIFCHHKFCRRGGNEFSGTKIANKYAEGLSND